MDTTGRVSCGVWMMGLPFNKAGGMANHFSYIITCNIRAGLGRSGCHDNLGITSHYSL